MLVALLIVVPLIILFLTLVARLFEGEEDIPYEQDEVILYEARRHWAVILVRCLTIVIGAALLFGIAFYRAIGGTFVSAASADRGNDLFNVFLMAIIALLFIIRIQRGRAAAKQKKRLPRWDRWVFIGVVAILAFIVTFRFDGGRILSVEPGNAVGLDVLNALLIGLGVLLLSLATYTYFDLRDDALILTNFRVLRREIQEIPIVGPVLSFLFQRKLVVREYLQQITIDTVQQVSVPRRSYFEYYLYQFFRVLERIGVRGYQRYGPVIVQSLSFQTIRFDDAAAPEEIQKRILDRVAEINRAETPEQLLRRTLDEQIWGNRPSTPRRFVRDLTQQQAGIFSWLFPPNPQFVNDKKQTIIWRPSWLFIIWRMLRALGALLLVIVVAVVVSRYGFLTGAPLVIVAVVLGLAAFGWAWWIYDTYQHDLYILNEDRIIDEDKQPFGPTTRREAELRAIQNVLFEENFVEGLLGIGDIIVAVGGAGGGNFTFHHVPNPREVQAQINSYIIEFRRREGEKNRRQTVQALTQYHTLQEQHDELIREQMINQIVNRTMQGVATTIATQPDEEAAEQVLDAVRREARWTTQRELRTFLRRLIRRQTRGRA